MVFLCIPPVLLQSLTHAIKIARFEDQLHLMAAGKNLLLTNGADNYNYLGKGSLCKVDRQSPKAFKS